MSKHFFYNYKDELGIKLSKVFRRQLATLEEDRQKQEQLDTAQLLIDQYFKKLKMSKQDLKDEYKNVEGNPEVKARIKRLQQEMSRNRMMSDVPNADVVVVNPEHYAVALRYDKEKEDVPRCVGKGVDHLALQMKKVARENNVFIYEEPPLARELYRLVDIGQEIPVELHEAIAEVLGFVYRAENRNI